MKPNCSNVYQIVSEFRILPHGLVIVRSPIVLLLLLLLFYTYRCYILSITVARRWLEQTNNTLKNKLLINNYKYIFFFLTLTCNFLLNPFGFTFTFSSSYISLAISFHSTSVLFDKEYFPTLHDEATLRRVGQWIGDHRTVSRVGNNHGVS